MRRLRLDFSWNRPGFRRRAGSCVGTVLSAGLLAHLLACSAFAQPANDNFANAQVLVGKDGMAGTVTGDNFGAGTEGGEPDFVSTYGEYGGQPVPANRTVWYRWTAPTNGTAVFETLNSDFDTTLSIYTGSALGSLALVGGNDDAGTGLGNFVHREGSTSFVEFYALAGTTYQVRVGGAPGHIVLDWSLNGVQSTNLFSGQFRLATDFLGPNNPILNRYLDMRDGAIGMPGGTYPLYVFSENETVASGGYPYARITVTRVGGAAGRVNVDYEIVPLIYTNIFITNYYGSNFAFLDSSSNLVTVFATNYVVTNIYGNATWFLPNPARRWYLTNVLAYNITFSNGFVFTTNLAPIPSLPNPCANQTGTPGPNGEFTNLFCASLPIVTTNIPSFITNSSPTDIRDVNRGGSPANTGRVTFNDFQMSADIAVPVYPGDGPARLYTGKADAPPVNRIFAVNLTNASVDPLESPDVLPPYVAAPSGNSRLGSALVNIMEESIAGWDGWPSNAIINLGRATWLTTEGSSPPVLFATRAGTNTGTVDVTWRLNFRSDNRPFAENRYPCVPGSDYATHDPYTNSPYYQIETNDFIGVTGTLHWDVNDFAAKTFQIPIVDDDLVEFNEDIHVELVNPRPLPGGSTPGVVLGNLGYFNSPDGDGNFANLTILFDNQYGGEQPAGAVDRFHNVDNVYFSTPPQMQHPGANNTVMALVVQSDTNTIIAGDFTSFNGTTRNRIARMLPSGYLDTGFLAPPNSGANRFIAALALQTDGKIVAGGDFTSFNGIARNRVVRLNSDGSVDTTFNPGLGASNTVWAVAVQTDGKVVIGGDFTSVGGVPRNHVARLNADGTLDTGFDPGTGADGPVNALAIQGDGKVVIGGDFTLVGGVARSRVARLNADGTLDMGYNPGAGANDAVYVLKLQPDGKALVGGAFTRMDFRSRNRLARLNTDGSLDTGFDPGVGADDAIYTIALQTDGKILIGGLFKSFNETRRVGVARLYNFGAVDTTFMDTAYNQYAGVPNQYHNEMVQPRNFIFALDVQPDGDVMIGGGFERVGGGFTRTDMRPRSNVARLIGGATPGPGNIELMEDQYSVDENAGRQYVTLVRTNGDRGMINARFLAVPRPPGPGAAVFTNFTLLPNYNRPFWNSSWPGDVNPDWGRIRGDGNFGPNYAPLAADSPTPQFRVGGSHTPDVFVTINDNTSIDGDRSLDFQLYRPSGTDFTLLGGENIPFGAALIRRAATSTILEDDVRPGTLGFSSVSYTVNEGVGNAVITVIRTNGSVGPVTVNYQTVPGPAALTNADAFADYTPVSGTLTFLSGQTNKTFSVPIIDDGVVEFDERVYLQLSNPSGGANLGLTNAVLTIVDNDYPPGRLNFTAANFSTNESARFALITVSRTGGALGSLTVQCATSDGTALAGTDYLGVTNTLSWTNGDVSVKTLAVPLLDDVLVEPNKTVNLRLFSATLNGTPTNAPLGNLTNAVLTIVDDDSVGAVRFSTASYSINENGGFGYITVVRTGGSSETVAVNFAATNGTAVAGFDFTPTNGTLIFGPGEVSKTFTVPILDNPFQDGTRTISLSLANASPSGALGSPVAALLSIIDDESVNEPPGSLDTSYSPDAGFNGDVLALALQPDGALVAAGDFTQANGLTRNRIARLYGNGTLDTGFSYGTATAGANATVRALLRQSDGRLLIGGDFTTVNNVNRSRIARLNLDGSLDTGFDPGAGADNPALALAETSVNGARKLLVGGSFTGIDSVNRNNIARLNDDGSLDFTFDPGLGANGSVYAIAVQTDGKVLIGGDFTAVNGIGRNRVARLNADGTLDLSFDPGAGANASVRALAVQLDGRILLGGSFTNYNGTAMNRIARLLPSGALDGSFTPGVGANDTVNAIVVQPDTRIVLGGQFTRCSGVSRNHLTRLNNDGTVDPTINFGLGANNFVAAAVVQPDSKIVIGGGFTEYDGEPHARLARVYGGSVVGSGRLEFASATFLTGENSTNAVITVRRRGGTSNPPGQTNVTVNAVTSDGTATNGLHYTGGTFPLSFPAGEVLQTFLVPVMDDFQINADRTVNLALTNIAPPGSAVLGDQPTATLIIVNDDSAISFASATYARNENAIDGVATITLVRSGSTVGTASVGFRTQAGGTATPGADYTPVDTTVTFNPGETVKNVTIPIINDTLIEGNETVPLELYDVSGAFLLVPFQAVLTIVDDDVGPGQISFAAPSYAVAENGGNAVITLVRTNGHSGTVSVGYYTSDGTATAGLDYTAVSGTVVFNDNETTKSILVPITDDLFVEGPETFTVTLANPTGGATLAGPTNAPVTIVDNDVGITFANAFYNVGEGGGSVTLTVLRINGSNGVATVNYATADNTATAGADYTATSGTLTFNNGETIKTFTIPILEDTLVEGDEFFNVQLSNPGPGVVLVNSNALVTIQDNDTGLGFAPATYSVNESGGSVTLTVVRTNANTGTVTVTYATTNGTATAGEDYTAVSGMLTFNNGESVKTITVPIANDKQVEGDETFFLTLSAPTGGAQLSGPSLATVTIVDDDAGLRFSSPTYTVSESGVQATITVFRTAITNTSVGVDYSTSDGTATAGSDYLATSGTLNFAPGEVSKTFTVSIIDDTLIEGDETVLLKLTNPTGQASLLNPNAATLTIVDNDGSLILPAGSVLTAESGPVNGAIDPGETVTLLFALRNALGTATTNLTATLLATNGVTAPSGPQNYGVLTPGGPSVSRSFSFTATGTNGGSVAATFRLTDGASTNGTVTFNYQLGNATRVFSNTAPVIINDLTNATPYPSVINVSGLAGTVSKVTVTLTNLSHTFPDDIDMLLVGPAGQNVMLMSDAGGNNFITNVTITLDDAAANALPDSDTITNGTYKPTNFLLADFFPAPAPPSPYGSTLATFNGSNPNGAWSLFIVDDLAGGAGSIGRGWSLAITTTGVIPAAADLAAGVTAAPNPVIVTSNLTYTLVVTNHGPSSATGIVLTNFLPAGAIYVSSSAGQGTISTNGGLVLWNIGTLGKDAGTSATIVARPTVVGAATNTVAVFGAEDDPNPANNTAAAVTTVNDVTADLVMVVFGPSGPVLLGQDVTYTLFVGNLGPATAPGVTITNTLPAGVSFVSATPPGYVLAGGQVAFPNLGSLDNGGVTNATIVVRPTVGGTLTNTATCSSSVPDPLKGNNTVTVKTVVNALQMNITISGTNLVVSWPADSAGFVLQRASSLTPPIVWTDVSSPAPQIVGDRKTVTLPLGGGNEFFRLRQ
jgi:uncharacterized delta-60 repeat protein/uncharacterized repeat protein (TIGR01451 family)